ncbi:MAG: multidrug transporter MatE [Nitrospirae bacterium GWC2_57_13]|jgi:antitoxin MazE|nr:MAG: multidrug transporter MatE [Nitrospirae bacterium GWC1_57_7]OGW27481.1 MAG: multidrug transporter MatE [Nitrospirae bacterium GWC2_57_13]HAR46032.1 AbrB/MazE/SpoVT family DNA-binding domain-containing protein [Nitrospiraceae bacterium]
MKTRVQKWGNSLALRIPKAFANEVGLLNDSSVEVSVTSGKLVVVPIEKPGVTLKKLLAQITEKNIHREVDSGPVVGNESW